MPPLTTNVLRVHSVHQPQFLPLPVKAGARIFLNAVTCTDANGLAVPGADAAGLRVQGVAWKPFDNTHGADGTLGDTFNSFGAARFVEVDSRGEWEFAVLAGPVPKPGDPAFVVDDNTVATATTHSILLGKFTRPGSPGKWFVDIDRR
ncbi:MAG TPA: hypothetical protein VN493_31050 [Thermoanaerobaculia bacterium]|nr:hypothetical protein [Thermoanaerobaculia bacterium]